MIILIIIICKNNLKRENIIIEAKTLINDLFLMTTADYPLVDFLNIAKQVKSILPKEIRFVANIGDFDYNSPIKLKEVGFTGIYHIIRLRVAFIIFA